MTEYDYSPGAIERHHAKLASIARWTQDTAQIRQKDPHSPPTPAFHPADLPRSNTKSSHHSSKRRTRSSDRDRDRYSPPPPPMPLDRSRSVGPRPKTAPPRGDIYGLQQPHPQPGAPSQFYAPHMQQYYVPSGPVYMSGPGPFPGQQMQHTRSRSTSQAPPPPPQPNRTRSYSVAPAPQMHPSPARSNSYPYAPPPGQKGYVYHPAPGYPPGYATGPPMNPALFNQQPVMIQKEPSLLKRVFGLGGGKSRDGGSGSGRSRSREGRPRRGDSY